MGPRLFSPRTKKIGPFLSLFLPQWRLCSWPRASPLVPGKRLGLLPPRTPAPCLARVIPKCTEGPSWSLGGTEDEAEGQSLDHTLEMAEGACPTFWKPVRVTSRFPKPWKGRAGHTQGARPLAMDDGSTGHVSPYIGPDRTLGVPVTCFWMWLAFALVG